MPLSSSRGHAHTPPPAGEGPGGLRSATPGPRGAAFGDGYVAVGHRGPPVGPGPRFGSDWCVGSASVLGPAALQAHEGTQEPAGLPCTGGFPTVPAAGAGAGPPRARPRPSARPPPPCTLYVLLVRLVLTVTEEVGPTPVPVLCNDFSPFKYLGERGGQVPQSRSHSY